MSSVPSTDPFQPSPDETSKGLTFHQRLLTRDPLASADLVQEYLPLLYTHLKIKNHQLDPSLLSDAATDACLNYIENPLSFKPEYRSLLGYLKMSAEGDLRNALTKLRRQERRIVPLEVVELSGRDGNSNIVEEEVLNRQEAVERIKALQQEQARLREEVADTILDQRLLELMQARVKKTHEYALVLGISDLAPPEQRRVVKQNKDRLRVRLKRRQTKPKTKPELPHQP